MKAAAEKTRHRSLIVASILACGFALIFLLQTSIDRSLAAARGDDDDLLIYSGKLLRKLSLGNEGLLADVYWTRAVQYYGVHLDRLDGHFTMLWPLLDISTTLDPHLLVAYHFGAIFLSQHGKGGAGRPDLAAALVRRGIAANPEEWQLFADLGFIEYTYLKDYHSAAQTYLAGARVPSAPPWFAAMAARVEELGGARETSLLLWAQVYHSTTDLRIRASARSHMLALGLEAQMEFLEKEVEEFRARSGHYPNSFRELVDARLLRGIPLDPAGAPYQLAANGKVQLDPHSPVQKELPNDWQK